MLLESLRVISTGHGGGIISSSALMVLVANACESESSGIAQPFLETKHVGSSFQPLYVFFSMPVL